MRILGGTIDWHPGYSNRPRLVLELADWPDQSAFVYRRVPFTTQDWDGRAVRSSIYYAEHDGAVDFVSYRGQGGGYGGQPFRLQMADGSVAELIGPYSSRAGVVNGLGLGPVMDVASNVPCGGHHVLLSRVVAAVESGLIFVPDYILPGWAAYARKSGEHDVHFPAGTKAGLHRFVCEDGEPVWYPRAVLPDGSTWDKQGRPNHRGDATSELSAEQVGR